MHQSYGPTLDSAEIATRPREFEEKYRRQFIRDRNKAELLILSFPKSGRTWHRLLLGSYLAAQCRMPDSRAFDLDRLCAATGIKHIVYSHNGANFIDYIEPANPIVASAELWAGKQVLLLVRNPKDLLVSAFHHAKFREKCFGGSLSEFVRDRRTGIIKILTAFNRWYAERGLASSFLVVSYEEMHESPGQVLQKSLAVAGLKSVDEALVSRAVDFCRFEKMQQYESADYFANPRLRVEGPDPRARKVREGRIGTWKNALSSADDAYIDAQIARFGNPFSAYTRA